MRIVIVTVGTRGDVQPYVALGKRLAGAGHDVRLATHEDFAGLSAQHGLRFTAICGNFRELLDSDLGRRWLESGDSFFRYRKALAELFGPLARAYLEQQVAAVGDAELVLAHPLAMGVFHETERRGIPLLVVPLVPWALTGEFNLFAASSFLLRGPLNRALWRFQYRVGWGAFREVHDSYRREVGLPALTTPSIWQHLLARGVPFLHLTSSTVVPQPSDWGDTMLQSGFCFLDEDGWTTPPELSAFLERGSPPIYLGFGSMTGFEPQALAALCTEAVRKAGQRAIIVSGWSGVREGAADRNIYWSEHIPHDWLFPRVSAVVHHGGAGTLAAGLRAGKPTVVVAFFGDQPFWGRRLAELGAGPTPLHKRQLTVEALAAAITEAVGSETIRNRAAALGAEVRKEDGLANAVAAIESFARDGKIAT